MGRADRVLLSLTLLREEEKLILQALDREGLQVETARFRELGARLNGRSRLPDLVLARNLSHREALAVARMFAQAGVPVVNSWRSIALCTDKASQALAFEAAGIPQPAFALAFSREEVRERGCELGGEYVVKPVDGSWGRGLARIRSEDELDAWAAGRESLDASDKAFPVLVQELVDKGDHDIRAVVVGAEPVVAFKRVAESWKTNTHTGASVEPIPLGPELRDLAARVAAVTGEGFYGLDLMEDRRRGRLVVCEVNHNPDFARSSAVHGVDVARHLALLAGASLERLADRRPEPRVAAGR